MVQSGPHGEGRRLAYFRERAGLRQADLARALGVHKTSVSNWELGKSFPRQRHLDAFLRLVRVSRATFWAKTTSSLTAWAARQSAAREREKAS